MDPDRELRKAVAWLNNEGGFFDSLEYEKIAEAAAGLPWVGVQQALNNCVDRRDEIDDHTTYVCAGLADERGKPHDGDGLIYWPSSVDGADAEDSTQEWDLRERVQWMNTEGGFQNAIRFEEVAEAAAGLESHIVVPVLSHLEEKWQEVNDPTSWVCAALYKERAGKSRKRGAAQRPNGHADHREADELIRKRLTWLNGEGGFQDALRYEQIAEAAWHVDINFVLKVLSHVLEKRGEVKDPTSWVCAALYKEASGKGARGRGAGPGGAGPRPGGGSDVDREVRRRVAWLNNEGGFRNSIGYVEVAEAASGVDMQTVVKIFAHLGEKRHEISNPTSWVCAALCKEKSGKGGGKGAHGKVPGRPPPPPGRPPPPVQKAISKK